MLTTETSWIKPQQIKDPFKLNLCTIKHLSSFKNCFYLKHFEDIEDRTAPPNTPFKPDRRLNSDGKGETICILQFIFKINIVLHWNTMFVLSVISKIH